MDANTSAQAPYWLALNRCEGLTSRQVLALLARFGNPQAVFEAAGTGSNLGSLSARVREGLRHPDWRGVELDLAWISEPGHSLVWLGQANYPWVLRQIDDPPAVLFVAGRVAALSALQLAMVGSRSATASGQATARWLARELVDLGICVTSGLARGIDRAAHRGACLAGGMSIGVAAHGLDQIYPRNSEELFGQVARAGALVSEFPLGAPPRPMHFPRRNRIVSGLSLGVVVVEAALRSGSLITARLAAEQGREVFAVPGPVASPVAAGCHQLLRDGATLVEGVEDVVAGFPAWARTQLETANRAVRPVPVASGEHLGEGQKDPVAEPPPQKLEPRAGDRESGSTCLPDLDAVSLAVLQKVDHAGASMEQLAYRTGLTIDKVSSILLALELRGLVSSEAGSRYALTPEE